MTSRNAVRPLVLEVGMLLAVVLIVSGGVAQASVGRMRGTVVDEAGDPIAGVQVTITCADLAGFREEKTTNKDGTFQVSFAQPHHVYSYLFVKAGYQSLQQEIGGSGTAQMKETFSMNSSAAMTMEETAAEIPSVVGTNAAITAFNEGIAALKSGDLGTARAGFEAAIVEDPELGQAHAALAGVFLDERQYEKALAAANTALALRPADREALQVSYEAYRKLGRDEEAAAVSEALKAAEDSLATARRTYNEGGAAYQAEDLETALAKFQEAASLDPNLYDAHHAVASLLLKEGDFAGAAEAADTALALRPEETRTLQVAYRAHNALGESEKATELLITLSALDPQFGASNLLEQGAEMFNGGRSEEAKALLEGALAVDPGQAKAHYLLGLYYINKGVNDEAKSHLAQFLEMAPDDVDASTARDMLGFLE